MVTPLKRWSRRLVFALVGAVAMIAFGQLFALTGASCTLLCRPVPAGIYGAILGLLMVRPIEQHGPPSSF